MAKTFNLLSYVISGLCFSIIVSIWIGYVKFLDLNPSVNVVMNNTPDNSAYGEVVINNEHCYLENTVSWPRNSVFSKDGRLFFNNTEVTTIPIFVNYKCEFVFFKKYGNQMIYAYNK